MCSCRVENVVFAVLLFAESIVYRVLYTLLVKQVKHEKYNTYALGNEAKVHLLNEHMLLIHQAEHNDKYKSPKSTDVWKECVIMSLHRMYHLHLFFRNECGGGLWQLHCT